MLRTVVPKIKVASIYEKEVTSHFTSQTNVSITVLFKNLSYNTSVYSRSASRFSPNELARKHYLSNVCFLHVLLLYGPPPVLDIDCRSIHEGIRRLYFFPVALAIAGHPFPQPRCLLHGPHLLLPSCTL